MGNDFLFLTGPQTVEVVDRDFGRVEYVPMSHREFFVARLNAELPAFQRVIRALPADQLDYRPHEKNTSARHLAWQLANEMKDLVELFAKSEIHFAPSEPPATHEEIASAFERNSQAALDAAKSVAEDRWEMPAKFYAGGNLAWEEGTGEMAWGYLFDMVHHRGQLSAYLRPMGGKVPSIYGPSADDSH
jgi:uncharacterized damage-inducible protein DinB